MLARFYRRSVWCTWLILVLGLTWAAASASAAEDTRFSATLNAEQRAAAGLNQLTDDNLAVIDALVRQEEAIARRRGANALFGSFSGRRSAHEKEIAGLALLTAEQLAYLDALIGARTGTNAPFFSAGVGGSPLRLKPAETKRRLEIHGSVSLMYGWSKTGSVRGGELVVNMRDPAHPDFSLTISYAEYRGKGIMPYYDPMLDLPRYRPLDEFERSHLSRELPRVERE
jgi:hypothetical protein